jgi:NADPH:quinone reductase-like Zn-dependent oxidoreductase
MKQIWITKPGDVDVLEIREAPDPAPAEGEVRVAVKAIGINFADIMARMGMYQDAPPIPCVVGYDIAGVVDACGAGVERFREGDRVFGLSRFGGYATAVSVPEHRLFGVPEGMDIADAAAIGVNYFTAYLALMKAGNLERGERLLVHSAGGGVGVAAIQLGRHVGAEIFGTASVGKHAFLREIGCDHPIDYRTQDFEREVMRLTEGKGVHLVLDAVGGRSLKKDYRILAPLGRIIPFGISGAAKSRRRNPLRIIRTALAFPWFHPIPLMQRNQGVFGLNLGHLWEELPRLRYMGDEIVRLCSEGVLRPHAAHRFAFSEVREAQRFMQDRQNTGKVVLTVE